MEDISFILKCLSTEKMKHLLILIISISCSQASAENTATFSESLQVKRSKLSLLSATPSTETNNGNIIYAVYKQRNNNKE